MGVLKVFRVAHQSFGERDLDFNFSAMPSKYCFLEVLIKSVTLFLSIFNADQWFSRYVRFAFFYRHAFFDVFCV